jgi:predicted NUDIX family NTP pyrophosphohydrolase
MFLFACAVGKNYPRATMVKGAHKTARKRAARPAAEKVSAGLLLYRVRDGILQVLLVHPGGPFWQHKDNGAWSIPKGGIQAGEEPLAAAQREFTEETGFECHGPFLPLRPIKQKSGKVVHAWAFPGNCDPARVRSISFEMEWPPYSGQKRAFPEVDRAAFFDLNEARRKIIPAQAAFLNELVKLLQEPGGSAP